MKQVIQNVKTGKLSLKDVPPPTVGVNEVLVATKASLISAGTEKMVMDFANKSLVGKAKERPDLVKKVLSKVNRDGLVSTIQSVFARLEEPLPLGYSAAGEVLEVGTNLKGLYEKGDNVAIAGAGLANHAEVNAVPKNLVVPCKNVPFKHACFATLAAIAMHGVRNGRVQLGDRVLVMGAGLVGQLAAQLATQAGGRVCVTDFDGERLKIAKECGIEATYNLAQGGVDSFVQNFTKSRGFDVILICAATESNYPLKQAATWARDRARVVMVGKVGTTIPYADYMKKELEVVISRSYGPGRYDANYENKGQNYPVGFVPWTERDNLAEAIQLMADSRLNVEPLISHNYPIEEAEEAYGIVADKDIRSLGVVLTYPFEQKKCLTPIVQLVHEPITSGSLGIALIGAGSFARSVLLPAAKTQEGIHFTGIASKGGLNAASLAEKFEFNFATANTKDIFTNKATDVVMIATRHDTHAALVLEALKAKKHVFVEKPLAMTLENLAKIQKAQQKAGTTLLVGTNRRFSPHVMKILKVLESNMEPRQILIRVNAGRLENDNWQSDPSIGGGRLIGEGCHFLDLAYVLANKKPTQITCHQGAGQDVFTVHIRFEDGSIADIFYTSEGDTSYAKERVEVYAGGTVSVIDNFRKSWVIRNGRKTCLHGGFFSKTEKGHKEEIAALFNHIETASQEPISMEELYISAALPLLAKQSLDENRTVEVNA